MKLSDSIANISKSLSLFQEEVQDPAKNSDNPFFKSKYVELDDLLQATRPVLAKHGLSVLQEPTSQDGQTVSIKTIILHLSGEWIEFEPLTLKAVKSDPQGIGSAITYGRRYSLSSILGVAWDADDDGNGASGKDKGKPAQKPEQSAQPQGSSVKWPAFWANMKTFGLAEDEVHKIVSEVMKKEVTSLSEVITTQQELNKWTAVLAKHKKTA